MKRTLRSLAWVLAALAVGCGSAGSDLPGATSTTPPAQSSAELAAAPVPLRRLTREEYNNTVRDLLGDTTHPADVFPPDEATSGFETNSVAPITGALVERYMDAAEAVAMHAKERLDALAKCAPAETQDHCAERFIETFGRRAYRRPLEDAERTSLLGVYTDKHARSDHSSAIRLVVEVILQSPQFLYRMEPAAEPAMRPLNGYELATRLSYFLWATTPDEQLLEDAQTGRLDSTAELAKVATRMLKDPRAADGIRSFHRQWLGLRELEGQSKDALAAKFTPELRASMMEETLRFTSHAILSGGDAMTTLLTSNETFVDAQLADLYGVPRPAGGGFARVTLPRDRRSGVLTHASVMTVLSSGDQTSPILRGKFVRERLLCQTIPPPPPGAVLAAPAVDPKLTTKERFAKHRTDPGCAVCHDLLDPIGFAFDHYDAIGAWRDVTGAVPVDATGVMDSTEDADGKFDGAVQLAELLARSHQVRRCFATHWFRYAIGRPEQGEDDASLAAAYTAFANAGFDVRELIVGIATSHAFRHTRGAEVPTQ